MNLEMTEEQGLSLSAHTAIPDMLSAQRWVGKEAKKGSLVPKAPVPRPQESTVKSPIRLGISLHGNHKP